MYTPRDEARFDGGGAGQTVVGQVRRRWGRSDGGGAGQTAVGQVRLPRESLPEALPRGLKLS